MSRILPIRVCSPNKTAVKEGLLPEIYFNSMLQAFFKKFKDYAVLSRKLGICLAGRVYENYGDYEEKSKGELKALLIQQSIHYQDTIFLYWNHRPIQHNSFVKLLREAGFLVMEFKTLAEIQEMLDYVRKPFMPDPDGIRGMVCKELPGRDKYGICAECLGKLSCGKPGPDQGKNTCSGFQSNPVFSAGGCPRSGC